jgi:hypothetical protein
MSVGDAVRSKINTVELALKDAGTDSAVHAIVDALKEIARALDAVEAPEKAATEPEPKKPSWDYSKGIQHI